VLRLIVEEKYNLCCSW